MTGIQGFLAGYRTYILIVVGTIDQVGVQLGYWSENNFRAIAEAALGLAFLRSAVAASGPVK